MQAPSLTHYQEFKEVLKDYQPSERAVSALQGLKFVLLLAATSTGRNTLIRHLVKSGNYHYVVSDTTRPPRINDGIHEKNGKEYWFRSEEDVLEDLRAGQYLEAEVLHEQQVSGISIRELEIAKAEGRIAITDIDLQGTINIKKIKPDVIAVLLLPPSFTEWQSRIMGRGKMEPTEYARRLKTAYKIFSDGLERDNYLYIIAEDVINSAQIIDDVAAGKPNPHQKKGKILLQQLLKELSQKLDEMAI